MANSARIDELLKKFDENPKRYFAPLANEYRKAGDVDQAITICREHLAQQPGHMSGHVVFGQALYEKGDLDEARQVFETALALDPENLIALRHLGDIARDRYDMSTARMWYQRVLDSDPRNEEIFAQLAALGDAPPPVALQAPATGADAALEPVGDAGPDTTADTSEAERAASAGDDVDADAREQRAVEPLELDAASFGLAAPSEPRLEMPEPEPLVVPASSIDMAAFGSVEPTPLDFESAEAASVRSEGLETTAFESHSFEPHSAPVGTPGDLGLESAEFVPPGDDGSADSPAADADVVFGFGDLTAMPPSEPLAERASGSAPVADEEGRPRAAAEAHLGETPAAFVTETMAELYLQQGFRQEALKVYRQLLEQSPDDSTLQVRVERLEAEVEAEVAGADEAEAGLGTQAMSEAPTEEWPAMQEGDAARAPAAAAPTGTATSVAPPAGPTMRQFFSALAARRPRQAGQASGGSSGAAAAGPAMVSGATTVEQPPVGLDAAPPSAVASGDVVRNHADETGAPSLEAQPVQREADDRDPAERDETESYFEAAAEGFADVAAPEPVDRSAHESAGFGSGRGYGYEDRGEVRPGAPSAPAEGTAADGSLDALFGAAGVRGDDAASSMLAGLYQPPSPAAAPGPATRPAASELSLDQVFRETPRSLEAARRASFSFDQFFASATEQSAATPDAPTGPPADEDDSAARDIEQFHAWLEGLKKK